ncbi:MAG: hypothetical protein JJ850_08930 [Kordiimonadaceae bacterium]|nr:hypothetical protein [Kordiimonadaceae bacterium]MBO6569252.1 hypothetical protein [Kordiimonadaceae bacterium]MBO6964728.1 hypothetical protein [Kordiimonadaceae bacterium]
MSDIAGPPAPKEVQPSVRGTDKASYVAKDPNNSQTRSQDTPQERSPDSEQEALRARDPAVSISATAAHLQSGQEISEKVARVDGEGRPIVVTDSVTIALKPDAGLKPNDEVYLKVVEADTRVTADLLRQNELPIDPPIRLTVTIIEVHQQPLTDKPAPTPTPQVDQPYKAPQTPALSSASVVSAPSADDVTLLVSGKTVEPSPTVQVKQPPATPSASTPAIPAPEVLQAATAPTTVRASSADLATLINQQQSTTATATGANPAGIPGTNTTTTPGTNPAATQVAASGAPTAPTAAIASTLTFEPAIGPGIGPAIVGVSLEGAPSIVQLLDPAQSKVSPAEVATVVKVQTLSAPEARALPVGASALSALADPAGELARVDTSRGSFVLPAQTAATLNDELVRIVVDQAPPANQSTTGAPAGQSFAAQFTATGAETATRVTTVFAPPPEAASAATPTPAAAQQQTTTVTQPSAAKASNSSVPANTATSQSGFTAATIQSVDTVSAFLSASGPKTDLKLTTDLGVLTLTVPSAFRPEVGASVLIDETPPPQQAAASTQTAPAAPSAPAPQTATIPPLQTPDLQAPAAVATTVAPHVPNMLASWPAMEETVAAVAGSAQAAGVQENIASKTAQGGGKMTNSLLFFLSATGRGGPEGWIGQQTQQTLAQASPSILKNLQSDIRRMAALPGESIGEWRPIVLPFDVRGSEVPLAALLFQQRHDIDPDAGGQDQSLADNEEEKSQRFIVQVQFSVLGDIQLDGNISKTNFDLTVRSGSTFSEPLKQDLEGLFYNALAANGFAGGLLFEEGTSFDVDAARLIETHLTQPAGQ